MASGTSVLKLTVDDSEYNASLKQAQQGLQHLGQALQNAGKSFNDVDSKVVDYVRSIGQMETQSRTARGRISEMSNAFIELSTRYNKMSDEVKKSDFGKALSESMERLRQRTIEAKEELESLNSSLNNIKTNDSGSNGIFSGLGGKMSGALQVFAGNMLTKAAGAVASLGSEMVGLVQQGVELAKQGEGIRNAFERLGRGDILNGLREATHGTVTDLELMKAAVKFNDFQLPVEELGTMLAFAQQKAKDTGQSVDYMVDSIVTGLGRKSLMILDNLGLSANEVKEKMKETGDMTKAVGEIIREQMAKAGDYVETAADRAAQANVSLQNKMEELGRKFAPLEEASSSLWTSMKIGILDIVGGPLTDLLNKLTAAGRMANAYGLMGGNAKVGRMIANLAGASEGNRQSIYQQQLEQFWRYINRRENALKDRDRWFKDMGNKELGEHLSREYQAFGTADRGEIQAQIDAAKKMLADYQQAAKKILQPIKQEIEPTITDPKSGKSGKVSTVKPEEILPADSIAKQEKLVQELTKKWREASAAVRDDYARQLGEAKQTLSEMQGGFSTDKIGQIQDLTGRTPMADLTQGAELTLPAKLEIQSPVDQWKEQITSLQEAMNSAWNTDAITTYQNEIDALQKKIEKFMGKTDGESMAKDWQSAANAIGQVGSAMQQIEDPAAKVMGTIAQAIATMALSYAQAASSPAVTGTGWGWIAFAATGLATMVSSIAAIKSATAGSYAEGGLIPGNHYSGDQQWAQVNAGELILNRSQQNSIAAQLQETERGGGYTPSHISGEQIYIALNRYTRRTGKGELVTWRN